MKGIAKALTSLSGKTEYKKIARNLKSLAMRANEGDKGAAKQIKTQLAKLATKVDKKAGAKLTKMSGLAATYEEVEIKEAPSPKISQDITDKLNWLAVYTHPTSRFAKAAIKDNGKGYVKDFKKLSDMIEDAIEVYDRIKKEIGLNEEVELKETIKKGDVFTKKEALAYFKKERKDFKPSELKKFKNKGGKVVMHWQDGETGEVVPMKEALDEASNPLSKRWVSAKGNLTVGKIELKRGKGGKSHTIKRNGKVIGDFSLDTDDDMWVANVKGERGQLVARDIDELVKRLEQLKESVELDEGVSLSKKGNYEVTVEGKSSVGIRIGLRFKGKLIVPGTKQKGMFVMGFNKADGKHKLPSGATIVKSSGKYIHIGFKKVDDIIAYAMLENIRERVSVDSRTKGYKEAVKRGIILAQKREAKKAKLEAQKQKEMEEDIANSTGVNIAGIDKPLGKVKKRKSFKDYK
jgi:hypothetical protein